MVLTQITYRRLFNTGSYTNESIELSGTLEPNEDTLNAYTQLHKMAQELHYSKNAEMYAQQGTQVRDIVEEPLNKRLEYIISDINSMTEIDAHNGFNVQIGLVSYQELAQTDPKIREAYEKKYEELTNKTN